MEKQVIVLGDIEMGAGTLTDDFISDKALSKLITDLANRKHPVDLILNGDTFDFLKCPYIKGDKKTYPRHITEEISIVKTKSIHHAHPEVFTALAKFVKKKKNRLYFIIGNHDQDLYYRGVQKELRSIIKSSGNVYFPLRYRQHGIHVEHGHQYDFLNKFNLDEIFLNYKGVSILNVSWVSFGIISKFLHMKERHPFMERIKPYPVLFSLYSNIAKKLTWKSFKLLANSVLYYPFRYYSDPTYTIPRTLLREMYYRFKSVNWDVDDIVQSFKKEKKKLHKNKIYVFGHVHQKYVEDNGDWAILQPDSWRDEYVIDSKTRKLTVKKKNYVEINVYDNEELEWDMKTVHIKRSHFNFNDIVKDEMKFLRLAAAEEGYTRPAYFQHEKENMKSKKTKLKNKLKVMKNLNSKNKK